MNQDVAAPAFQLTFCSLFKSWGVNLERWRWKSAHPSPTQCVESGTRLPLNRPWPCWRPAPLLRQTLVSFCSDQALRHQEAALKHTALNFCWCAFCLLSVLPVSLCLAIFIFILCGLAVWWFIIKRRRDMPCEGSLCAPDSRTVPLPQHTLPTRLCSFLSASNRFTEPQRVKWDSQDSHCKPRVFLFLSSSYCADC